MGLTEVRKLTGEIAGLQAALDTKRAALRRIQTTCKHRWSEPMYTPNIQEGYQIHGDPPGTMGVDRQLPMYVPRKETPRWTRCCNECYIAQVTEKTRDDVKKVPVF